MMEGNAGFGTLLVYCPAESLPVNVPLPRETSESIQTRVERCSTETKPDARFGGCEKKAGRGGGI